MEFIFLPEFNKELNSLSKKRFRTLNQDLDLFKQRILIKYPRGYPPAVVAIDRLVIETEIYKVKHFRCRALKDKGSRSGIRIVYAYFPEENKIEFIQIYYKEKDDVDCNRERILRYYK
ncbi:hypothetical protein KKG24_00390 [Patescibacteria group bacterium]|nr:hypothetical protein [Patescibacteria group bacterium]